MPKAFPEPCILVIPGKTHETVLIIYLLTREMSKPLVTNEHPIRNLWTISPLVMLNFSYIIVILSGDVSNPSFRISLIILMKSLPNYLGDVLELRNINIDEI